ncbi:MAG: UDP-N-acetylmuramoyl-L-alanyl-D-glutamate--2,6-diaminopimelate ligase [Betaproteobacteria bacterium]|nr:MAG: UDP-N-acetylmuramoyl-L-alanyl-D-glutamate--2,6-diaminopimelate ligase [Betaproteobacteria bacterium]
MHPVVLTLHERGIHGAVLQLDSREVKAGDVFFAFPGRSRDGRDFIGAAIAEGAAAIVCERGSKFDTSDPRVIEVDQLEIQLGKIANDYLGAPSEHMAVYGVTGTNGKTTVATWIAQAHEALGERCGFVGTVGSGFLQQLDAAKNTTPDAITLHHTLSRMRQAGAGAAAIEVSSHALDQGRVAGVRFESAIFTNLTQDHLDYHGSMDAYGAAKAKLFTDYVARHRIINADDAFGASLIARKLTSVVSYGMVKGDVLTSLRARSGATLDLEINSPWGKIECEVLTVGKFNAYNATAVAAALLSAGKSPADVARALSALTPAAGRLERVVPNDGAGVKLPMVLVDYAHTPDALEKAIIAARESTSGKLWLVFGCGGNRDRSKRPIMGEIASRLADVTIVTSDNPRDERPEAIADDIVQGIDTLGRANIEIELDRKRAIESAVVGAKSGDCILIAGKGHESYQEISGHRYPFSDTELARSALNARHAMSAKASHAAF